MLNFKEDYKSNNIIPREEVPVLVERLKKQGKKIGLCTGSFDLLHPGHIAHLESAKKMCDILFVSIAKDEYVAQKTPNSGRPVFCQELRAFMISKLNLVDFVFLDDAIPEQVLFVKPDIYIKGLDYSDEKNPNIIIQKKMMESFGGKMVFTKDKKLSTTEIIKHIKEDIK